MVTPAPAADSPQPAQADWNARDFKFASGETIPELRIHYRILGHPERGADGRVNNAVLIMHGTGGSGATFIGAIFGGELFNAGQPLDLAHHFIVIPDAIGHGQSAKPSDGLRAHFPAYGYRDMVRANYLLLTEGLKIDHLRLVLGTSMGAMQTWLWGELHPDFMDALMPLASVPDQISGRNEAWRHILIDAIRHDPDWKGGDYVKQPPSLRTAEGLLFLMGSSPVRRQVDMSTRADSDAVLEQYIETGIKKDDANDVLYAVAASRDYDPKPALEKITAPLIAVNSADDLINPPELGILEHEIKRVPHGRAVVIPAGDGTYGHQTHTHAAAWKRYLIQLLGDEVRP